MGPEKYIFCLNIFFVSGWWMPKNRRIIFLKTSPRPPTYHLYWYIYIYILRLKTIENWKYKWIYTLMIKKMKTIKFLTIEKEKEKGRNWIEKKPICGLVYIFIIWYIYFFTTWMHAYIGGWRRRWWRWQWKLWWCSWHTAHNHIYVFQSQKHTSQKYVFFRIRVK